MDMQNLKMEDSMTEKNFIELFWKNWQGKKLPGKIIKNKIESSLRDSYYSLGFKKVKPLESIPGIVTENKFYQVLLIKDKHFPKGEECILGDNQEYVTLDCFKKETVI